MLKTRLSLFADVARSRRAERGATEAGRARELEGFGHGGHEAIAVQHLDGNVMVNLIDPETGLSASTSVMQANGKKASKLTKS